MKELRLLVEDRAGEFAVTLVELEQPEDDERYARYTDWYHVGIIRLNIVDDEGTEMNLVFEPKGVQDGR